MKIHFLRSFVKLLVVFVLGVGFVGCKQHNSLGKEFVADWRQARHADYQFFEDFAMRIRINEDGTGFFYKPSSRIEIQGHWYVTNVGDDKMLVIKNDTQYEDPSTLQYNRERYFRYYFFRVNKIEKGKMYLNDVEDEDAYDNAEELLFKPVE